MSSKVREKRRVPPARTPEQREEQLINLAMDNAERLLVDGNAPSQVITHFLKLADSKYKAEIEKLKSDTALSDAKLESLKIQQRTDEKYEEALNAFRIYTGEDYDEYEDEYDD